MLYLQLGFDIIPKDVVPTYFMYGNVLSLTERHVEPLNVI